MPLSDTFLTESGRIKLQLLSDALSALGIPQTEETEAHRAVYSAEARATMGAAEEGRAPAGGAGAGAEPPTDDHASNHDSDSDTEDTHQISLFLNAAVQDSSERASITSKLLGMNKIYPGYAACQELAEAVSDLLKDPEDDTAAASAAVGGSVSGGAGSGSDAVEVDHILGWKTSHASKFRNSEGDKMLLGYLDPYSTSEQEGRILSPNANDENILFTCFVRYLDPSKDFTPIGVTAAENLIGTLTGAMGSDKNFAAYQQFLTLMHLDRYKIPTENVYESTGLTIDKLKRTLPTGIKRDEEMTALVKLLYQQPSPLIRNLDDSTKFYHARAEVLKVLLETREGYDAIVAHLDGGSYSVERHLATVEETRKALDSAIASLTAYISPSWFVVKDDGRNRKIEMLAGLIATLNDCNGQLNAYAKAVQDEGHPPVDGANPRVLIVTAMEALINTTQTLMSFVLSVSGKKPELGTAMTTLLSTAKRFNGVATGALRSATMDSSLAGIYDDAKRRFAQTYAGAVAGGAGAGAGGGADERARTMSSGSHGSADATASAVRATGDGADELGRTASSGSHGSADATASAVRATGGGADERGRTASSASHGSERDSAATGSADATASADGAGDAASSGSHASAPGSASLAGLMGDDRRSRSSSLSEMGAPGSDADERGGDAPGKAKRPSK